MTNYERILRVFEENQVEFIIVGGAAATAHGSSRLTEDLDIVYSRTIENISRLVSSLAPYDPYPRGVPPGLPFSWDINTISNGLNFTLSTSIGSIDILGEITGGGKYEDLKPFSIRLSLFGTDCLCLGIEKLIEVKRAAGRPKDFEVLSELELILQEKSRH
jgi:hypothetical protein